LIITDPKKKGKTFATRSLKVHFTVKRNGFVVSENMKYSVIIFTCS